LITIRCVDEVAAGLHVSIEKLLRACAVGAMTPARAEVAGAQSDF
jgi:hypothetical protein